MDDATPAATPFTTSLKLTDKQLRRLLDFVTQELSNCCKEMGRGKDGMTSCGSWLDRRRLNQLWYEGDLAWREGSEYLGGIFADSNFTRGDGKRYVRHLAAKITDDLLGTSPFFAALKKNTSNQNPSLSKAIEEVAQEGIERSNVPDTLREAVELALVRNEAVVKVRNVFMATGYVGPAEVLVDANGQPVLTPQKGLYIFKNDDLLPVPDDATGKLALEKDASFEASPEQAAQFTYQEFTDLPQTEVRREGLEASVLDPRDFITNLKGADIHDNVICAHYYDERPEVLRSTYGGFPVSGAYFCGQESGAKSPIASQGEQPTDGRPDQWVPIAEVYVRFDADEDGREEEILLVMDRDRTAGEALFYDYLHKHMKKRPFEVILGLRKVPSRWYGIGIYTDKFDQLTFVDKTFNRINLKSSKTSTVTAVRRDAIEEWGDMKSPVVFGGDDVLTLSSKWSDDKGDWLQQKRLIEVTEEETALMRDMLQAMDLEFGVLSAADASASQLNSSKTATGVASIERSGDSIVKAVEHVVAIGITAVLEQSVDLVMENLDQTTLALSKDSELLTLNRDEIRALPRNVTLLLTRARSTELLATNQQATQKANEYFDLMDMDPRRAKSLRPLYIAELVSLEVQDPDSMLPEITGEDIAAWKQAKQNSSAPQKPESLSISYKDAPDPIRRQMEAMAGMTPLTPQQEAVEQQQAAAEKVTEADAKAPQKIPLRVVEGGAQ